MISYFAAAEIDFFNEKVLRSCFNNDRPINLFKGILS